MALTDKQKRFCDEYLVDLNATQAAMQPMAQKMAARANPTMNGQNGVRAQ